MTKVLFIGILQPDPATRLIAENRVHTVLRRAAPEVARVVVRRSDVNGPRGGLDKRSILAIRTGSSSHLVVSNVPTQWRTALDVALSCVTKSLRRFLERARRPARVKPQC